MDTKHDSPLGSGLRSLITIARFHQLPAEESQIQHQFGIPGECFGSTELLRAAKSLGFKTRHTELTFDKLNNGVLPAILVTKAGDYAVIAKVAHASEMNSAEVSDAAVEPLLGKALVLFADKQQPDALTEKELDDLWSGEIILISKREGLLTSFKEFDIKWFILALLKYKKFFGEVLIISFFLQLFALATPLFFQVVMDKVLVHRGFTTLDVLAFGLSVSPSSMQFWGGCVTMYSLIPLIG